MRLLIASMAALAAVAFAAPSYAQTDETMTGPAPAPVATPSKAKSASASCQKLKSASQRNACLKKANVAKAQPTKKTRKPASAAAPKQPDVGQLAPPAATAPAAAPSGGTVAVPPLPSKTI